MSHTCDFPTDVRLLEVGSLDVLFDFHDPDGGYDIVDEIVLPAPNQRQSRLKSARAHGSYPTGARLFDDGQFILRVGVYGTSWGECTERVVAMVDAMQGQGAFYLETELDTVVTRWYCDAPVDVNPEPLDIFDRANNMQRYELRFLVQPNPTVTIA